MTADPLGYRTASSPADTLPYRMAMSPTGRQLAIDGGLVAPVFASDPSLNTVNVPPDGTFGFWVSGTSLFMSAFTRETGWVSAELTP